MKPPRKNPWLPVDCSMPVQPAPVAALITALIDIECLSHSLAASRDDLDRYPRGEPWPTTPRKFTDYVKACRGRSRPGDGPLDRFEARQIWDEMTRANKHWQCLREGMTADYCRWAGQIKAAIALLPQLHPHLDGLVARPREWTSKLRVRLHRVRAVVIRAGNNPWVIAASQWTAHLAGISDARSFLQAADFPGSMRPCKPLGWTKAELIDETGIDGDNARIGSSMFIEICRSAKVRSPERGQHTWRFSRDDVKLLIAAAGSGSFSRKGPRAASAWTKLLE